jgi:molybdate transport system substrate-binding protein
VGIYLVSEIRMVEGVTLAGLLPSELQSYVVYAGAVAANSASPDAALEFLRFLADPAGSEHWKAAGFESV